MQKSAQPSAPEDHANGHDDIETARAALRTISFFRSERPENVKISRLGGLTNSVFKVECNGDRYVMRLPGDGTSEYIDRDFEAVALREASRAGVSPGLVYCEPKSGVMVSEWVNAMPMTPSLFRSNPGAARRAGEVLQRLHRSDAKFDFKFDLFGMLDEYSSVLAKQPVQLPAGLADMLGLADELRKTLTSRPVGLVACHCDLLPDNFLDTGTRMFLVDWEFSGMNDPMWDLGDAIVECGLQAKEEHEFLLAYFSAEPKPAELGRVAIYKAMCDLLWTLWGLIQHANGNPADDFRSYAARRFARAQAVVADRNFARLHAAVAQG